jgi:hypothetical protein
LISSIVAEIESNIDRTDWDEGCYEECRKLMQHAAEQIKVISEDRGKEEIPVLVDLEGQHWIAETLETAAHTLELVEGRITQLGEQRTGRNGKTCRNELGRRAGMSRAAPAQRPRGQGKLCWMPPQQTPSAIRS